jgi:hypothetical protein
MLTVAGVERSAPSTKQRVVNNDNSFHPTDLILFQ